MNNNQSNQLGQLFKNTRGSGVIVAILVSAFVVSVALGFVGMQLAKSNNQVSNTPAAPSADLSKEIEKGVEAYIAKMQESQEKGAAQEQAEAEAKVQSVRAVDDEDYLRGSPGAKLTIIEYSDYECPFCKRNHPTVIKVMEKYPDQVNWVYRHLPLPFHLPNAQDQAEGAECVGELNGAEAFWKYTDLLYERTESNKGFAFESIKPLAVEVGVDESAFTICMESDRHIAKITKQTEEANAMGVRGTPANLIRNNETGKVKFLGGAYPFEAFVANIDELLK